MMAAIKLLVGQSFIFTAEEQGTPACGVTGIYANGSLMDDSSAIRAQDVYTDTLMYLKVSGSMDTLKYE